jgi:hypothetical protein
MTIPAFEIGLDRDADGIAMNLVLAASAVFHVRFAGKALPWEEAMQPWPDRSRSTRTPDSTGDPAMFKKIALTGFLLFGAVHAEAGIRVGDLPGATSYAASASNRAG